MKKIVINAHCSVAMRRYGVPTGGNSASSDGADSLAFAYYNEARNRREENENAAAGKGVKIPNHPTTHPPKKKKRKIK